jgi:hypothetical protein
VTETSVQGPEAQAVIDLVKQFRRLSDPASDPDAAVRAKIEDFLHRHLVRNGSEGTNEDEAQAALSGEIESTPRQWPDDPVRLARLLVEVFDEARSDCRRRYPRPRNWCAWALRTGARWKSSTPRCPANFRTLRPNENVAAWRTETAVWQALRDRVDARKLHICQNRIAIVEASNHCAVLQIKRSKTAERLR